MTHDLTTLDRFLHRLRSLKGRTVIIYATINLNGDLACFTVDDKGKAIGINEWLDVTEEQPEGPAQVDIT